MDWRYKATLQLCLSCLPWGEKINHQLQKHYGGPSYFLIDGGFADGLQMLKSLDEAGMGGVKGKIMVEVGTGWQPIIPVICACLGAQRIFSYDHVAHLRAGLVKHVFIQVQEKLRAIPEWRGISTELMPDVTDKDIRSLEHWLRFLNIDYRAPADAAETGIAAETADIFFSNKVLEHVSQEDVLSITREAYRVLKPGGLFYSYIGMLDHYAYFDKRISRVNCLRYSDIFWRIMAQNRVSYQSRLRKSAYLDIIAATGFELITVRATIFDDDVKAVKGMKLARRFEHMDPEDLAASFVEVIARKPSGIHRSH